MQTFIIPKLFQEYLEITAATTNLTGCIPDIQYNKMSSFINKT